jgi:hypothetical protein
VDSELPLLARTEGFFRTEKKWGESYKYFKK